MWVQPSMSHASHSPSPSMSLKQLPSQSYSSSGHRARPVVLLRQGIEAVARLCDRCSLQRRKSRRRPRWPPRRSWMPSDRCNSATSSTSQMPLLLKSLTQSPSHTPMASSTFPSQSQNPSRRLPSPPHTPHSVQHVAVAIALNPSGMPSPPHTPHSSMRVPVALAFSLRDAAAAADAADSSMDIHEPSSSVRVGFAVARRLVRAPSARVEFTRTVVDGGRLVVVARELVQAAQAGSSVQPSPPQTPHWSSRLPSQSQ